MRPVATAVVDVLYYHNESKNWVKPEGSEVASRSTESRANVHLIQECIGYRIFAERVHDNQILVDQAIFAHFHYKVATPVFHQWKSENKQVFGLSFVNPDEAEIFSKNVEKAVAEINAGSQMNGNGGNIYQDPQVYAQQQFHRETDQESIGSASQMNYRNQQKSSYSSLHNGQTGTLNQQNRRCSSGSNGPSSSNIYATNQPNGMYNGGNSQISQQQSQVNGGTMRVPVPPPAPPPPPGNGIAPISSKAPPPPPPPPDLNKMPAPAKSLSLADQLKSASLRKTSGPPVTNNGVGSVVSQNKTNGDVPQTPQPKNGGGNDFFSELAAKIESRNNSKNCKADTVSTSSSSGVSSSSVGATASDTSDSGATLTTRKANGDASVNSGTTKPWQKPNGILTAGITAAAQNNGIESPKVQRKTNGELSSPTITVADLNQFKQEILAEVRQEIARAKQEILEAIRNELGR